jgi:hypothetical protein
MGDCQPIPVYLEIRALATTVVSYFDVILMKAIVLGREQEDLQRCSDHRALYQSWVEGRHPRPLPPNSSAHPVRTLQNWSNDRRAGGWVRLHQNSGCTKIIAANPCSCSEAVMLGKHKFRPEMVSLSRASHGFLRRHRSRGCCQDY